MADPLARVGVAGGAVTRVYVGVVSAVASNLVTVDPGDGDIVDQVPWYGQTPLVGDTVVLLLSGSQLLALSMGR